MNTFSEFWLVWCDGGGVPTVQHPSLNAARREAERLAATNSGRKFWVMRAVGFARNVNVAWVDAHETGCRCSECIPF